MKEIKNTLAFCVLRLKLRYLLFARRTLIRHSRLCHQLYLRYSARLFHKISRISQRCTALGRLHLTIIRKGGD